MAEGNLLKFLTDETDEDVKIKAGAGPQKARKGYIAHIVQICKKMQECAETNKHINKIVESSLLSKLRLSIRIYFIKPSQP